MTNKNHLLNIAVMTAILAAGIVSNSCKKIDPDAAGEDFPAAAFTLSAVEDRYAPEPYLWTISKNGVTDSVSEELDQMYVTRYNTVTLEVKPTGSGFQGVNVRSSNPETVRVTKLDETHYDLSYLKDGEADISVWNGEKKDIQKTTFHVKAQNCIAPEAVVFVLDEGTPNEKIIKLKEWFINDKQNFKSYWHDLINYKNEPGARWLYDTHAFDVWIDKKERLIEENMPMHTIKFKGIEPENTSFRTMEFQSNDYNEYAQPAFKNYLQQCGLSSEWFDSWTGDISDFNKTCYYITHTAKGESGYSWSKMDFSLCELTFKNSSTQIPIYQTAMMMYTQWNK